MVALLRKNGGILDTSGIGVHGSCCWIRCRVSRLKEKNKKKENRRKSQGFGPSGKAGAAFTRGGGLGDQCDWGEQLCPESLQVAVQVQGRPPYTGPGARGTSKGWRPSWGLQGLNGIDSQGLEKEEELSQGVFHRASWEGEGRGPGGKQGALCQEDLSFPFAAVHGLRVC